MGLKGDRVKGEGKGEGALSTDLTPPPRDKGKAEGVFSTDLVTPTLLDKAEQERRPSFTNADLVRDAFSGEL